MKTKTIPITPNLTQGKWLRIALDGGCDIPNCSCSSTPFITVSDGKQMINVELTAAEVTVIKIAARRGTYAEVGAK